MSLFTPNEDAFTVDAEAVSYGPKLGFLGAFQAAHEAQTRASSMFGLEVYFERADNEQRRRMHEAGVKPYRALTEDADGMLSGTTSKYYKAARAIVDGKDEEGVLSAIGERDAEIEAIRKQRPDLGLKTYKELLADVQTAAQEAEKKVDKSAYSLGGTAGWLAGTAAGALDPRTDPFNTLTIGVGGIGRSVVGRIATEGGAQGAIEAVNQVTGVQDNRRLLGLDHGLGNALGQIGASVLVGAGFQGVAEGVGAVGRRWWTPKANDPVPVAPPSAAGAAAPAVRAAPPETPAAGASSRPAVNLLDDADAFMAEVHRLNGLASSTPLGRRGADADFGHVNRSLDAWDGPAPWAVRPPDTATALPGRVELDTRDTLRGALADVDTLARRADPETYRIYDNLQRRAAELRAAIDDTDKLAADAKVAGAGREAEAQIAVLEAQLAGAKGKRRAVLAERLDELRQSAPPAEGGATAGERQSALRADLVKLDEQMRDLAIPLSRARAQAERRFVNLEAPSPEVVDMLARANPGSVVLNDPKWMQRTASTPADLTPQTLTERVPVLASRPDIVQSMPDGSDAADAVRKIIAENGKVVDEAVDAATASYKKIIELGVPLRVPVNGEDIDLPLSTKIAIVEDGETRTFTVKELLQEQLDDDAALRSIQTCSVPQVSSTV